MTILELQGIAHELTFWKSFVQTDRFLKDWCADDKTAELRDEVYEFIMEKVIDDIRKSGYKNQILDVGSGAVSILHGSFNPYADVQAVDPLGDLYNLIFDYGKYNLKSPLAVPAEHLGEQGCLQGMQFDIVHCSNAIDHCQWPEDALCNMLKALKEDGYLIIQGFVNEGSYENWQGFHQWNVDLWVDGLGLLFRDAHDEKMVFNDSNINSGMMQRPYSIQTIVSKRVKLPTKKDWFIWIAKKVKAF